MGRNRASEAERSWRFFVKDCSIDTLDPNESTAAEQDGPIKAMNRSTVAVPRASPGLVLRLTSTAKITAEEMERDADGTEDSAGDRV